MKGESARVHARITADTCRTRVGQVKAIVELFRFSLPHPHDFYPSTADICWIPEVQKVIIDGTDQEFQHCKVDIQARISGWSTTWLEERRKVFMQLLPQDSPTVEDLSLATTMFDCERCPMHNMHIEEALLHYCYYFYDGGPGERLPNDIISRVYRSDVGSPWDSEFSKYKYSAKFATLVRKAVLECGENPETITTREMSRKHHRFAYFRPGGTINLFSWHQMVSSGAHPPDYLVPHFHTVSSDTCGTMEITRVDSYGPMNSPDIHLNLTEQVFGGANFGGAFIAGDLGSESPNGITKTSSRSNNILLPRKFILHA